MEFWDWKDVSKGEPGNVGDPGSGKEVYTEAGVEGYFLTT